MNESCHTYEWIMSRIPWVMSVVCMSHVTHMNEYVTQHQAWKTWLETDSSRLIIYVDKTRYIYVDSRSLKTHCICRHLSLSRSPDMYIWKPTHYDSLYMYPATDVTGDITSHDESVSSHVFHVTSVARTIYRHIRLETDSWRLIIFFVVYLPRSLALSL